MSHFFASGNQSTGVSASTSVLPKDIQDWFPLGWTSWISLLSKGHSRDFSNTTVQKHQFFCTVIYLGPNYAGGNEDNGDLLQKVPSMNCYTYCPQPCSRPPLTRASTGDSWTLTGKSESDSCGVTASVSWVLVHTRFCLCPPRVCFPVLCKFWLLYSGLMVTSSMRRRHVITKSAAPRAPDPMAVHCWPVCPQETHKHSSVSVSVGSLGPGAQGLFEPSEQLWRLWGLILNATSPLLPSCWGFSPLSLDVGYLLKVAPAPCSHHSSAYRPAGASLLLDMGYLLTAAPAQGSRRSVSSWYCGNYGWSLTISFIPYIIVYKHYILQTQERSKYVKRK